MLKLTLLEYINEEKRQQLERIRTYTEQKLENGVYRPPLETTFSKISA